MAFGCGGNYEAIKQTDLLQYLLWQLTQGVLLIPEHVFVDSTLFQPKFMSETNLQQPQSTFLKQA